MDGRIFITEKHGSIRVVENDTLLAEPVGDIKVENRGCVGYWVLHCTQILRRITCSMYITYSNNTGLFNRVLMLQESNNRIIDSKTIVDGIPGGKIS